MYITIYFDDKPLFLCDRIDENLEPFIHHDDTVFIDELDSHTVKTMLHEMQQPKVHAGVFLHPDLDQLKKAIDKKFLVIRAGGGRVVDEKGRVLLIFRKGKWDLPKGKLDDGETIEQCALREVEEETGARNLVLGPRLAVTYHTYAEGAHQVLKESHWYAMHSKGEQELRPQVSEQITEIRWVPAEELGSYCAKSFPAVADVLRLPFTA